MSGSERSSARIGPGWPPTTEGIHCRHRRIAAPHHDAPWRCPSHSARRLGLMKADVDNVGSEVRGPCSDRAPRTSTMSATQNRRRCTHGHSSSPPARVAAEAKVSNTTSQPWLLDILRSRTFRQVEATGFPRSINPVAPDHVSRYRARPAEQADSRLRDTG